MKRDYQDVRSKLHLTEVIQPCLLIAIKLLMICSLNYKLYD